MEKLLCKTCGTRHWPREPCPAVKAGKISDVTVLEPVKEGPGSVRAGLQMMAEGVVAGMKRKALTDAVRARRYREAGGDVLREANKLRMREKRGA